MVSYPTIPTYSIHTQTYVLLTNNAQQGMSWVTRKAISYATVTLNVNQYTDSENVGHIDIDQTLTGGIKGTTEKRIADWNGREHSDHIFGTVEGRSRFLSGSKGEDGKVRPDVDVCTNIGGNGVGDARVKKFLRGEILADDSECEGFLVEDGDGLGVWFQSFVENKDEGYGWTAEQVWIFSLVAGWVGRS